MKVGILTFQFADNYGALLQAYALKTFLEEFWNSDVEILNYANDDMEKAYEINPLLCKSIKKSIITLLRYPSRAAIKRKFNEFRKDNLGIIGKYIKNIDCSINDILIVGSDQVWNKEITHNDMTYFLKDNLINENKKTYFCSYAASANNDFVDNLTQGRCLDLFSRFDAISVREEGLHFELCERCNLKNQLVCDPVFLLSQDEWDDLICSEKKRRKPYILMYSLKGSEKLDQIAKDIQKKTGYEILLIHPMGQRLSSVGRMIRRVGPKEFVALIKGAEYVVSNSFHAFAFSIIYSKKIYFEYIENLSNRVKSLLNNLKIKYIECDIKNIYYADLKVYNLKTYNEYVQSSKNYLHRVKVKSQKKRDNRMVQEGNK